MEEIESDEQLLEKFETIGKVSKENDGKIIADENDEKIKITFESFNKIIKYCGGWVGIIWINIFYALCPLIVVYNRYLIGKWTEDMAD